MPGNPNTGGVTGAPEVDDDGFLTIGEKQAGAVANRQLRFRGMTAEQIKALVRKRVLHRTPARGVYRVAGAERSPRQDLWVALLAAPEGSLASHLSAAALRGLLAEPASLGGPTASSAGPSSTTPRSVPLIARRTKEST